jgi:V/A-type H+-transporting ATPase subunit G/H
MERVLSMGERLQRLIEEAEKESEKKIAEAQKRAEEMIAEARDEAENRRISAQRGDGIEELTRSEEERARKEAANILEGYGTKAEAVKKVPRARFDDAVSMVLREVLPR